MILKPFKILNTGFLSSVSPSMCLKGTGMTEGIPKLHLQHFFPLQIPCSMKWNWGQQSLFTFLTQMGFFSNVSCFMNLKVIEAQVSSHLSH
jgi:hypothetical protein